MIQVREYARLTTDPGAVSSLDCGVVSEATLDWLQNLMGEWGSSSPVVTINNHRTLTLGSYVGFLQSPTGESIEILPKTRLGLGDPEEARKLLQRMLLCSLGIKPRIAGPADLLRMDEPLHEWVFSQFLTELKTLVVKGLRFDYLRVTEESQFIRGRVNLDQQQRQPPGRQHVFHICHDVYTPNRLENRLLKTALGYVLMSSGSNENWRRANELSHLLADIPIEAEPLRSVPHWQCSRLMQGYEEVRPWCELILEKLNPNFQQGQHKGVALLFPMELLFEKYVGAALHRSLPMGSRLTLQARSEYLLRHKAQGSDKLAPMFRLEPDLLLTTATGKQVLDTKWKLLNEKASHSESKYNITQGDLYQMFAYGHAYQKGEGHMMLIYPRHESFNAPLPAFKYSTDLSVWAVPFCLKAGALVSGEWENYFDI